MLDWDDLRFVLAVSRTGSALAASRQLGVNQTTVTRRLASLEASMGEPLLDRRQSGHRLNDFGRLVATAAEAVEADLLAFENEVAARRRSVTGSVRFTCPETIGNHLLAPWLVDFRRLHPDVRIEVINADAMLELGKGEADVAIRVGAPPTGSGVVAHRLPDCPWTAYCSRGYAAEHRPPAAPAELHRHPLVGLEGAQAKLPSAIWFERLVGQDRITVRCNSLSNALHSLRGGLGVGMLPTIIGDTAPDLMRCFPPVEELNAQMWLIIREEVKSVAHVRAFADFLLARMQVEVWREPAAALAP